MGINGFDPFLHLDYMLYQLKYDSVLKGFQGTLATKKEGDQEYLTVNGKRIYGPAWKWRAIRWRASREQKE